MKLTREDILFLRLPLTVLGIAIVLAAVTAGTSRYVASTLHIQHDQSLELNNTSKTQLAQARSELQEIHIYLKDYLTLAQKSVVGGEQRLDWVENLVNLSYTADIDNAHYDFSEQHPVEVTDERLSAFSLQQSTMHLNLKLVHEGELLRFLQQLKEKAKGTYFLDHCKLSRPETSGSATETLPRNIEAACELSWVTFHQAAPPGEDAPTPAGTGAAGIH